MVLKTWRWWWLAVAMAALGCHPNYTRTDPVLDKPLEELTDADVARMVAVVKTNYGEFRFELHPEWAPRTTRHFIKLVRMGIYGGRTVFEARPNTWILIGDPTEKPEITGFQIAVEEGGAGKHERGVVGLHHFDYDMASGGSNFYVMVKDRPKMDGGYTVFGKIIEGMAVVDRIALVPATCEFCGPAPYLPLSPVNVLDVYLAVRQ